MSAAGLAADNARAARPITSRRWRSDKPAVAPLHLAADWLAVVIGQRRELWRDLRSQSRRGQPARDQARHQRVSGRMGGSSMPRR